MSRMTVHPNHQQGLSIVELMIALLLGSILIAGIFQVFMANSQAFRMTEAIARSQEYGRIAADILSAEARGAGYFGCNSESVTNNLAIDPSDPDYDDYHWDIATAVSSASALRPAAAIAGTDFVYFSGMGSGGLEIAATQPPTSASTRVKSRSGKGPATFISDGDIIAISDCQGTDIVQVTNINGDDDDLEVTMVTNSGKTHTPGNDFTNNICSNTGNANAGNNCLSHNYVEGAQILKPYDRTYFIGTSPTTGESALMMQELVAGAVRTHEMVEGVVDMQIQYGLSAEKTQPVSRWEDSDSLGAGDWGQIRAVRVSLLVRAGSSNVFDEKTSLCYPSWSDCSAGNNYTAADNRMYRDYSFTTNVRNKSS
ncbi:PilW family protein [Methylophaga sp.]|uniref:PilW family protein n=1 Tax=Methylophaga sp. TaxID=2024840 RepID=UPI003A8CE679